MVAYVRNAKTMKAVKWLKNFSKTEVFKPIEDYLKSDDVDEYSLKGRLRSLVSKYNKIVELGVLDRVNEKNIGSYFKMIDTEDIKKIYKKRLEDANYELDEYNTLNDLELDSVCTDLTYFYTR